MPEMHWFGVIFLAAVGCAVGILLGAYREHKKMKAEEEKFTPTHRRTRERD
ncbi:hypothetical protein LCGC14_2878770 [marine sediment metagenome]|uniref:Uncharacterized protein n=1 Tax=marine sediment metagenome TaxID=412755 RepID=A0A0F8YMI3_9ZZZZ